MKRILPFVFLLACIVMTSFAIAGTPDSLLNSRNSLYYQYLDIKNNTEKFKESDYVKLTDVLEQVLFLDNRLIDTLDTRQKKLTEVEKQLSTQDNSALALDTELTQKNICKWIVYIGGGLLFVLFVIFCSLYIKKNNTLAKLKKQYKTEKEQLENSIGQMKEEMVSKETVSVNNDESLKKISQEKDFAEEKARKLEIEFSSLKSEKAQAVVESEIKIQQLTEELNHYKLDFPNIEHKLKEKEALLQAESFAYQVRVEKYEKQIDEINATLNQLRCNHELDHETLQIRDRDNELQKNEIAELRREITEKDKQIAEFRGLSAHDDKYYLKLAEVDLNMIKIENLERLREKKAITDEEYQTLKQKFLGQL
jgi:hypothetical protein